MPRLPRKTKVDVAKCHACHVKRRWTSPNGAQARHQSQPSATSATPATQRECGCLTVPRLPRKNESGCRQVLQARHQSQPSATSATPATERECGCLTAPRLPRKTKVNVAKCHACHAKLFVREMVCDKVVCDKVVCDKVVCDKVVCDKVVCV